LLRLFSSHFQQLFYFGSGLSVLSSNQSSHLRNVVTGISPRLCLGWIFSKKCPMRDTLKKKTIGRHRRYVSLAVFFLQLGMRNWHWPCLCFFLVTQLWTKPNGGNS
jgi:hypothetical protein